MNITKVVQRFQRDFKKKPFESSLFLGAVILIVLPILAMGVLLVRYSVNTPFWDQWQYVDLMSHVHTDTLTVNDLWQQSNEHRLVVPKLITIGLGQVTNWNFRVPVFMNLVVAIGSYTLLLLMLMRVFKNKAVLAALGVAFAWLLFSPNQWINWIWGFQLAFFLAIFFALLTIWLLTRADVHTRRSIFIYGVVAATIATYCNGNGLIMWPVGLGILLWHRASRERLLWWIGVGVVVSASYLYKFHRSPDSLPLSVVIREPVAVFKYVMIYLGRNLSTTQHSAVYVGSGLMIVFILSIIYIYKKHSLRQVSDWIALAAYSITTALLAAVSRLNFGVGQAFIAISYTTISLVFILAVIALVVYAYKLWLVDYRRPMLNRYIAGFVVLGVLLGMQLPAFFGNYSAGTFQLQSQGRDLVLVQHCVLTATSVNDPCLLKAYPNQAYAWQRIQILRQLGWGGFKKASP